jgi:hypothetical protein
MHALLEPSLAVCKGSDWEIDLSGSDEEEDAPASEDGCDGGIDAAELENLRREAAGGSPRPAEGSRRKRGARPGPHHPVEL